MDGDWSKRMRFSGWRQPECSLGHVEPSPKEVYLLSVQLKIALSRVQQDSDPRFDFVRLEPHCVQDDSVVFSGLNLALGLAAGFQRYTSGRLCAMRRNATLADEYEDSMELVSDPCVCVPA
jgi:hypothetical protein